MIAELLVDAPPGIRTLPRDAHGYPIPFFVAVVNGQPDQRLADGKKRRKAVSENLCWICGKALGSLVALIGGPESVRNRVFTDWAMHPGCAVFAVKTCPYLKSENAKRSAKPYPTEQVIPPGLIDAKHIAVLLARGAHIEYQNGFGYVRPNRVMGVQWYRSGEKIKTALDATKPTG